MNTTENEQRILESCKEFARLIKEGKTEWEVYYNKHLITFARLIKDGKTEWEVYYNKHLITQDDWFKFHLEKHNIAILYSKTDFSWWVIDDRELATEYPNNNTMTAFEFADFVINEKLEALAKEYAALNSLKFKQGLSYTHEEVEKLGGVPSNMGFCVAYDFNSKQMDSFETGIKFEKSENVLNPFAVRICSEETPLDLRILKSETDKTESLTLIISRTTLK